MFIRTFTKFVCLKFIMIFTYMKRDKSLCCIAGVLELKEEVGKKQFYSCNKENNNGSQMWTECTGIYQITGFHHSFMLEKGSWHGMCPLHPLKCIGILRLVSLSNVRPSVNNVWCSWWLSCLHLRLSENPDVYPELNLTPWVSVWHGLKGLPKGRDKPFLGVARAGACPGFSNFVLRECMAW